MCFDFGALKISHNSFQINPQGPQNRGRLRALILRDLSFHVSESPIVRGRAPKTKAGPTLLVYLHKDLYMFLFRVRTYESSELACMPDTARMPLKKREPLRTRNAGRHTPDSKGIKFRQSLSYMLTSTALYPAPTSHCLLPIAHMGIPGWAIGP